MGPLQGDHYIVKLERVSDKSVQCMIQFSKKSNKSLHLNTYSIEYMLKVNSVY